VGKINLVHIHRTYCRKVGVFGRDYIERREPRGDGVHRQGKKRLRAVGAGRIWKREGQR